MAKTTVFELNATLKAGRKVFMKGSRFTEETLPAELRDELNSGSGTIEVTSFGSDFESANFDPEETITMKEPLKKLKSGKEPKKKLIVKKK